MVDSIYINFSNFIYIILGGTMKHFLWRLLGRRFWIKLNSHYKSKGNERYSEWEQKKDTIKNHYIYGFHKALNVE